MYKKTEDITIADCHKLLESSQEPMQQPDESFETYFKKQKQESKRKQPTATYTPTAAGLRNNQYNKGTYYPLGNFKLSNDEPEPTLDKYRPCVPYHPSYYMNGNKNCTKTSRKRPQSTTHNNNQDRTSFTVTTVPDEAIHSATLRSSTVKYQNPPANNKQQHPTSIKRKPGLLPDPLEYKKMMQTKEAQNTKKKENYRTVDVDLLTEICNTSSDEEFLTPPQSLPSSDNEERQKNNKTFDSDEDDILSQVLTSFEANQLNSQPQNTDNNDTQNEEVLAINNQQLQQSNQNMPRNNFVSRPPMQHRSAHRTAHPSVMHHQQRNIPSLQLQARPQMIPTRNHNQINASRSVTNQQHNVRFPEHLFNGCTIGTIHVHLAKE